MVDRLERRPGTYVLLMRPRRPGSVQIGRLGQIDLQTGYYVYVGSAFGSGGIGARVARHLRGGERRHWHIDYLLPAMTVEEVWLTYDAVRQEEAWAGWWRRAPGSTNPLRRFGAGDCRCDGHLFFLAARPSFAGFQRHAACRVQRLAVGGEPAT